MTSPRGVRRNIYPYDASDPNLKWCGTCDYPYMPAGGCKEHEGRCLTCCAADGLDCHLATTQALAQSAFAHVIKDHVALDEARRRVQAEIDSLYGADGER